MMKRAIVVGATSGIGMHVAVLLAAEGWTVGVAGRRTERLETLCKEHENIVCYQRVDVNSEDASEGLAALIGQLGGMDLYVHSSGIGWQNVDLDAEKEVATAATNAVGFTRMLTAAFNYFADKGLEGHIAAISSIAGTKGLGAAPAYSATKRFQQNYLESLSQLTAIRGLKIRITDIRPGFVATDLLAGGRYPLQLNVEDVARLIVRAIKKKKAVTTIDWRYGLLVFFWRLLPRWLWVRLRWVHS